MDELPAPEAEAQEEVFQSDRLEQAFREGSPDQLREFFEIWQQESRPFNPQATNVPEFFRHAYEIFTDFYAPKSLARYGDPEWGTEQFENVSFLITQKELWIQVAEDLDSHVPGSGVIDFDPWLSMTINDFAPTVRGDTPVVYLDDNYEATLTLFLGAEEHSTGEDSIMSPSHAVGESARRQEFINQFVQIYHGHWGGWRLATDPVITRIVFDTAFSKAIVYFQVVYEGGEARYERTDGKWQLQSCRLTWIT